MPRKPADPTPEQQEQGKQYERQYRKFSHFARAFWKYACSDELIWVPHMDIVCDEFQALVTESDRRRAMRKAILARHGGDAIAATAEIEEAFTGLYPPRLVLEICPRASKSKLTECLFPAWRWLHAPGAAILALSSSEKLVEKHGLYLRDVIRSPDYVGIQRYLVATGRLTEATKSVREEHRVADGCAFGIRTDKSAMSNFLLTSGGGRNGFALGSKFTGEDADTTVIDDAHDVDEAMKGSTDSQARAVGDVVESYRHKVQDRSNNKLLDPILCIGQPVHIADLGVYIASQPGAKLVCLPAEYDPDHPNAYRPGKGFVADGKDWRTTPGELLDPARLSKGLLDFYRHDDAFGFATKYGMRRSVQEGVRYRRKDLEENLFDEDPRDLALSGYYDDFLISVDAANKTGRRNDYTSMGAFGRKGTTFDLLDRESFRAEIGGLEAKFRAFCARWPMIQIKLIEDKANGTALIQTLKLEKYGPGGVVIPKIDGVVPITPKGDKPTRSAAYAEPVVSDRRLRLPRHATWRPEYTENMVGFGAGGAHDDDTDMTSQALQRWANLVIPWLAGRSAEMADRRLRPAVRAPGSGHRLPRRHRPRVGPPRVAGDRRDLGHPRPPGGPHRGHGRWPRRLRAGVRHGDPLLGCHAGPVRGDGDHVPDRARPGAGADPGVPAPARGRGDDEGRRADGEWIQGPSGHSRIVGRLPPRDRRGARRCAGCADADPPGDRHRR